MAPKLSDSVPVGILDSEPGPPRPPPPSNGRNQSPPSDDQELGSISARVAKEDSARSGCRVEGNYKVVGGVMGVNSIDIKNLGPVRTVRISLPRPANRPIFNLTSRANFRAKIYVN